jgi:hypothetical protein
MLPALLFVKPLGRSARLSKRLRFIQSHPIIECICVVSLPSPCPAEKTIDQKKVTRRLTTKLQCCQKREGTNLFAAAGHRSAIENRRPTESCNPARVTKTHPVGCHPGSSCPSKPPPATRLQKCSPGGLEYRATSSETTALAVLPEGQALTHHQSTSIPGGTALTRPLTRHLPQTSTKDRKGGLVMEEL